MNKLVNGKNDNKVLREYIKQQDEKIHNKMGEHTFQDCYHDRVHQMWGLDSSDSETSESDESSNEDSDSDYVDLGLPSGTKWATKNLGASSKTDYGLYFAWGETTGYEGLTQDKQFTWEDYQFFTGYDENNNNLATFNKYNSVDQKVVLKNTDDAAYQLTNGGYRIPTGDEASELINNCTYEFITDYKGTGVNVAQFTGPNGNKLIIPAAGYYKDGQLQGEEDYSYIWTNTVRIGSYSIAYSACQDYVDTVTYRYYGMPIRPIKNEK